MTEQNKQERCPYDDEPCADDDCPCDRPGPVRRVTARSTDGDSSPDPGEQERLAEAIAIALDHADVTMRRSRTVSPAWAAKALADDVSAIRTVCDALVEAEARAAKAEAAWEEGWEWCAEALDALGFETVFDISDGKVAAIRAQADAAAKAGPDDCGVPGHACVSDRKAAAATEARLREAREENERLRGAIERARACMDYDDVEEARAALSHPDHPKEDT